MTYSANNAHFLVPDVLPLHMHNATNTCRQPNGVMMWIDMNKEQNTLRKAARGPPPSPWPSIVYCLPGMVFVWICFLSLFPLLTTNIVGHVLSTSRSLKHITTLSTKCIYLTFDSRVVSVLFCSFSFCGSGLSLVLSSLRVHFGSCSEWFNWLNYTPTCSVTMLVL